MLKKIISASVMCANFCNLEKDIKDLERGGCDWLHFDIMDGSFVPNFTFGPDLIKTLRNKTKMKFDTHLMIVEPIRYIKQFAEAGSDIIVVHQEACSNSHKTILNIKENKVKAGIAINPATNINVLEDILPELDMILIMCVNPGFAGQKFISSSIDKVKKMKEMILKKGLNEKMLIQVDGNINPDTSSKLIKAGANVFVAGTSFIFKPKQDIYKNTVKMRKFLKGSGLNI